MKNKSRKNKSQEIYTITFSGGQIIAIEKGELKKEKENSSNFLAIKSNLI